MREMYDFDVATSIINLMYILKETLLEIHRLPLS